VVLVVAKKQRDTFTAADIREVPTVDRQLQDIVRLDSRAFIDRAQPEGEVGFSILGFNTRFNNLIIDGVSAIDSFGDNFSGLPTRRSPISLDAIESLAVETAPFDAQNSGFQGGQINIQTKSGGNEFHGSAFYQRSGGFLTGNRAGTLSSGQPVIFGAEQPENSWGVTLSGPILKDRLFFLFNYEEFSENDALGSCPEGIACDNPIIGFTADTYQALRDASVARYGIDPGDYNDFLNFSDGERKFLGKIDWNISDRHRASVQVNSVTSNNVGTTGADGLDTPSSFLNTQADTLSLVTQVFSNWTDRFSTQLFFSWRDQRRAAAPLFGDIPQFIINFPTNATGGSTDVSIGPDETAQNAILETTRFQWRFRGE